MDIKIQALHFELGEAREEFITKKLSKLDRFASDIQLAEVTLKIVKPDTADNKEASVKLHLAGADLFADKTADTFEEAVDVAIDALKRQLEKRKEARK